MWTSISRLFTGPRRRTDRTFAGPAAVMETRQMLAATVSSPATLTVVQQPYVDQLLGNFYSKDGKPPVYVSSSSEKGSEVGTFWVYDPTGNTAQITLSGKNAKAFEVQLKSIDPYGSGGRSYAIQVANSRLARQGSHFDLTLTYQKSPDIVITRSVTIVSAHAQTIVLNENPSDGQLLGRLPARLRAARMQYKVVAGTFGFHFQEPVSVESGGRIVAHPLFNPYPPYSQNLIDLNSTDIAYWPDVFNYERVYPVPPNSSPTDIRHSGDVLVEVYDPRFKTTEHVHLRIDLRNVDEAPVVWDQSVNVGLDGTGGRIWFQDPDSVGNIIPLNSPGGPVSFNGPFQMKIVSGDNEGIFTIPSQNVDWYGQAHQLKAAKPELLRGRDTFTLRVQLLEKGKLAKEVTVNVKVLPHVDEVYLFAAV